MSGRGWSPDAEEAPANHADWADDPSKPTPAQRAAAIADKAVDEITNSGYHYWCGAPVASLPPRWCSLTAPWARRMRPRPRV